MLSLIESNGYYFYFDQKLRPLYTTFFFKNQ